MAMYSVNTLLLVLQAQIHFLLPCTMHWLVFNYLTTASEMINYAAIIHLMMPSVH